MASGAIVVEGLDVDRGGRRVVRGVSLRVAAGEVTGLLGPNGSGKTTLMRSIVGVQVIAGGHVNVLGEPAGSPSLRRRVGYVTQAPSVYADLSVAENLRYFARVLDAPRERVGKTIETVGLGGFEDRVTRDLSGGEHARVSLATALLAEPDVLVLDEPTVGLDPLLRQSLWRTFGELAARGATLLVSSHVMDEAEHCDRLVLMHEGRVLTVATPDELRDRTGHERIEDAFVALIEEEDA